MKPVPLLLTLPFLLPAHAMAARPLAKPEIRADGRYEFRDKGTRTRFRIATDELEQSGTAGIKKIHITAKDHLLKVQETAKQLSGGGTRVDLVAYVEGAPETDLNRRIVTHKVAVTLSEGMDPTSIGLAAGATRMTPMEIMDGAYIMEFEDAVSAITAAEALKEVPGVLRSNVMLARKRFPAYIPDDPFFPPNSNNGPYAFPIFVDHAEADPRTAATEVLVPAGGTRAYQWYLNKEATSEDTQIPGVLWQNFLPSELPPLVNPEFPPFYTWRRGDARVPLNNTWWFPKYFEHVSDINVKNAWDITTSSGKPLDGTGVKFGIVDDGVQLDHPDINSQSVLRNDDYNYIDGNQAPGSTDQKRLDPTPPFQTGGAPRHGTGMAGLILATRDNARGMSGVAPGARFAAYRAVGGNVDDASFADALTFGAPRLNPVKTPDNPLGLPTGNEWRRNGISIKFDVSVNAWAEPGNGFYLVNEDLYFRKALAYGVTEGRHVGGGPQGVIYVFPAGNGGDSHGDTNYSYTSNTIYGVTVGSVSDIGRRILTSNPGASLHVVAPSAGFEMAPRIIDERGLVPLDYPPVVPANATQRAMGWTVTTNEYDRGSTRNSQDILTLRTPTTSTGQAGYDNNASGTSVSTALVSGVIGLMLEANPNLGWRDVQEILMRSAQVIDPVMGEWQYNHLGIPMSHKYGAGLVDAERAVRMARVWENLGPRFGTTGSIQGTVDYKEVKGQQQVFSGNRTIPDNEFDSPNKQVLTLNVNPPSSGLRVEHVVVRVKISHGRRGDLGIILTSPQSGQSDKDVESYLLVPHREDYNEHIGNPLLADTGGDREVEEGEYWDFTTVRHWGTSAQNNPVGTGGGGGGSWTLTIWDNTKQGVTRPANINSPDPQNRVFVPIANPPAGKLEYASVSFHGTTSISQNEPPVITSTSLVGPRERFMRAFVGTTTDLRIDSVTNTPRAPVYNYRVRVLEPISANAPDLVIGPSNSMLYRQQFPEAADTPQIHLRFDQETGILTNAPYPDDPSIEFIPLPRHQWLLEVHATNVFGTTRKQVPLQIKDALTYTEWRETYFTPEELLNPLIRGDMADPDGDLVPNLLEYAMGGNPLVYEADLLPQQSVDGENLVFPYQVDTRTVGFPVTPQTSSDLNPLDTWTNLDSTLISTEDGVQQRMASIPIVPGTRQFIRLRAGS